MSPHWYALSDLPQVRAVVRVWWMVHGTPRQMDVARTWIATRKAWAWALYQDGDVVTIPPKGRDKARWAPEPVCWQPRDEAWVWPGKPPKPLLPHQVPRLEATRQSFDAAELAAEMERDREDAQARPDSTGTAALEFRWWSDGNAIKYEPAGEIGRRMVEGRVLRALAWCGAGQGLTLRTTTVGAILARMAEAASAEARAAEAERFAEAQEYPPFHPLPKDRDDFGVAMAWFTALNPPENWRDLRRAWSLNRTQRVMLLRTTRVPLSWADIGAAFGNLDRGDPGISGTRCQQLYASGVEACWRVANGGSAFPHRRIVDQIEALQERNRAHRRNEATPCDVSSSR